MRKNYAKMPLALILSLFLASNLLAVSPIRILYLATDAATTANDLFLADLSNNANYTVTKRVTQASFTGNYDDFDLIVLHETISGGEAATAGHETRLLKDVDKPILNTKSYVYNSTARWDWGAPNGGKPGKGIHAKEKTHPVFAGITLDANDSVYVFNEYFAKNSQPTTITIGGYEIGSTAPAAAGGGTVSIHDLPASVRLGAGKTSKYLMVSVFSGSFEKLTADGIKLLNNAVTYLVSGTQFTPGTSGFTPNTIHDVTFDGRVIRNTTNKNISIYNVSGSLVAITDQDFDLTGYSNGLYLVRSGNSSLKVLLNK